MSVTLTTVYSLTDSGQELRADVLLTFSGTYSAGGETASSTFKNIAIKTRSFPKALVGVASNGYVLDLDTTNSKIKLVGNGPGSTAFIPAPTVALAGGGAGNVDNGTHDYAVGFTGPYGTTLPGLISVVTVSDKTSDGKVAVSGIPNGPAGTTAKTLFRSKAGAHVLYEHSTISDNTTTTATDNTADASLTVLAPAASVPAEFNGSLTSVTARASVWFKKV